MRHLKVSHILVCASLCIVTGLHTPCHAHAQAPHLFLQADAGQAPAGPYWPLSDGTGQTASDPSNSSLNGTLEGDAAWAQPGHDAASALSLTKTGYVDVPTSVVDTSQSFTVSAWVRTNTLDDFQTFVSQDGTQVSGFFLQMRPGGVFAFTRIPDDKSEDGTVAASSMSVQTGVWYNLVGVYDASAKTISLYVDGVLQQTLPFTSAWNATGHTEIGRGEFSGNPTDFVDGEISDVHLEQGVHIDTARLAQIAQQSGMLTPKLGVDLSARGPEINPEMFGLMIEDISHSIDGGLYAELIQNRVFKNDPNNPVDWSLIEGDGSGTMALDANDPVPDTALTECLRLNIDNAGAAPGVGVANSGYWGIPVHPSTTYHASLYAMASGGMTGPLTLRIESADGSKVYASATVPSIGDTWKQYFAVLKTSSDAPVSADNRFVVYANHAGTVLLTQVSLFPPTYDNRPNGTRIDLMDWLAAMKPGFLRMPGGNYLEGNTIAERFDWKKTIGPISQRPGHQDPWGYRSDDGFGLLEYLEWCQDLHMEPLLAVYAGYSLGGEHVDPGAALQPFVQDALDEIQYVTGGVNTKWGAVRAADGHPAPFALNDVEIGNEDFVDRSGSYDGRYTQFYRAIKAVYPQLQLIATANSVKSVQPDIIDEHYYLPPAGFEAGARHYDTYSRTGPKIFVGEYASQEGSPTPDMDSALGDAAFMTGMERNADVVRIASYAPLLVNINPGASQWGTNLIGFNAIASYVSPSYYVQKMFSLYHGTNVAPLTLIGGSGVYAVASRDADTGLLDMIIVNAGGETQTTAITLNGAASVASKGTAITLSAPSPTDTNSISDPNRVVPVTKIITGIGKTFRYPLVPYSVTVLQLKAK